jgi:acyl-CoA thioesterase
VGGEEERRDRVRSLTELMDLRERSADSFEAPMTTSWGPRMFGGLVAAQSLAAACRTVRPEHRPQSLHAYFILAGDPTQPLELDVERTRDGRSFTTRRVVASQAGAAIFEMSASFHRGEEGAARSAPMPAVVGPDEVDPFLGSTERPSVGHFEMRPLSESPLPFALLPYWVRTIDPVPDDVALSSCMFTYLSDMGILAEARPPDGEPIGSATSLDHAIWFHRPYRPHEWHLYSADVRSNHGGRGLAVGSLHHEDGALIATVVQEGLFRPPR